MQRDLEQPGTLARLLRELPDETTPPYGWSEFRRRAGARAVARRDRAGGRSLAALAAIAIGIVALSLRLGEPVRTALHPTDGTPARGSSTAADPVFAETPPETPPDTPRNDLRADMLERWLASQPDEPALVRVGNRAAVTGLEDRLAEVDDLLTSERVDEARPANLLALQQERWQLVSSLAQVRYAEKLADVAR
jgi:hypothetical protein